MTVRIKGGNGPVLRAAQRSDVGGTVQHDVVTIQLSGGTTQPETIHDGEFLTYTGATYYRGGKVYIEGLGGAEIINLDPSVGTVSEDGTITRLSSGILRLRVRAGRVTIPLEDIDLRDKSDEADQPNQYVSAVEGSLAEHCQQQVDNRLAAIAGTPTMAANGLFYTTQDHAGQTYTRNPDLWCSQGTPVDLTCISPWNSNGANRKAGTLVTSRHVLNAAHYEYTVGTTVRFVNMAGAVFNYTITGKKRHPDYSPYSPDLTVYTLNEDVDASLTPCKLMPSVWNAYLVQNNYTRPPALGLDQEEKALVIDFYNNGSFLVPTDATRAIFHESKISGDSGNPAFLIVNDELVLVTCWTYGGAGSGTPVANHIADLNQMIADSDTQAGVSTGYTVTEADFSAWPNLTTQDYIIEDHDIANGNASAWKDVNGDQTVYRYYKASLTDYEEARIDGGVWKIYDEADTLIATGDAGGDITAVTFAANGYTFSNP